MQSTESLHRTSPTNANRRVVERLWTEGFNAGDLEVLSELVSEEFTNFGKTVNGPEFLGALITSQRTAFPDMRFEPVQTHVDGQWVITKMRWTGTFHGPFSFIDFDGVTPTGRRFDVEHVHAFRFVDGKVAEHWAVRDDLTMHKQLLTGQ